VIIPPGRDGWPEASDVARYGLRDLIKLRDEPTVTATLPREKASAARSVSLSS